MQQNVDLLIILTCLDYIISDSLDQWFSSFHQPSPPSKFNWRIITVIYRVIYRVMQYHGRATYSEGLCSWPPENRSVAPKGGQESRLRNYGLDILNHSATSLLLGHALTKLNNSWHFNVVAIVLQYFMNAFCFCAMLFQHEMPFNDFNAIAEDETLRLRELVRSVCDSTDNSAYEVVGYFMGPGQNRPLGQLLKNCLDRLRPSEQL